MGSDKCKICGNTKGLKWGWDNNPYCCESHERKGVNDLHASMPGGPSPYMGWLPSHVSMEITKRWEYS